MSEEEVFEQEVSKEELENVAGGGSLKNARRRIPTDCAENTFQMDIYGGAGFPNCAATMEDGSWCDRNDACFNNSVDYQGMVDCSKAWR